MVALARRNSNLHVLTSNTWSKTFLSRFCFLIPFSWANFCHFVIALGSGIFLDRGRRYFGGGSLATTVSSTRSVGNCQTSFNSNCTLSRVRAIK